MKVNYFVEDLKQYLEWKAGKEEVFLECERQHEEEDISSCGRYKLDIYKYMTQEGRWNYTEGVITRLSDNKEIGSVKRNYSAFPYKFVDNYLLCGENYQGYSVIDLEKEEHNVYFPDAGFKGHGFCWACIYDVVNNKLIVEGCYWGGPYEVVIYDFTNPTTLPLQELHRFDIDGKFSICDNIISIEQEVEYRKSDGALYDDLSDDEQKELDSNFPKLSAYKMVELKRNI
jgi:hypothetical protein